VINWYRYFTLKEFLQFSFYKLGTGIIRLSGYNKFAKELMSLLQQLLREGFNITRMGKLLCINGIGLGDANKYLIRPGTTDIQVFRQVIIDQEYFPIINGIKESNDIHSIRKIVDAGSNIGMTTLFFKNFFPEAKIIAIEPDKGNFNHLKKNIGINGFLSSVTMLKAALWKNSSDNLYISSDFRDGKEWSKSVTIQNKDESYNHSKNPLNVVTLQNVINLFEENHVVDILKIDIEGSESELFKSFDFIDTLKTSVRFLCLEIHDELKIRQDIYRVFDEINFSITENNETCFCVNKNLEKY
jgi:FkbM family methyltransferase